MDDGLEKLVRSIVAPRHLHYIEIDGKQELCLSKEGVRELTEYKIAEEGPHGNASRFRDWLEVTVFPSLSNSGNNRSN